VLAENLVFVDLAGRELGQEDLPDAAGGMDAHRMAPPVPAVEVADDADALGARRPDREGDAADAFVLDRVCAELLVAPQMVAFGEEVDVEFAEHRRETVGILELVAEALSRVGAQAIRKSVLPRLDRAGEEPGGMHARQLGDDLAAVAIEHLHALGPGLERAKDEALLALVQAEEAERVAVSRLHDGEDGAVFTSERHRSPPGVR